MLEQGSHRRGPAIALCNQQIEMGLTIACLLHISSYYPFVHIITLSCYTLLYEWEVISNVKFTGCLCTCRTRYLMKRKNENGAPSYT